MNPTLAIFIKKELTQLIHYRLLAVAFFALFLEFILYIESGRYSLIIYFDNAL